MKNKRYYKNFLTMSYIFKLFILLNKYRKILNMCQYICHLGLFVTSEAGV